MGRMLMAVVALFAVNTAFAQVDLDQFLQRDRYETIKISPDGLHYAATISMEDRTGLAIVRRADMTMVSRAIGVRRSAVADFWWVSNDRLVIAMAQSMGSKDPLYVTGELHGLGIDGSRAKTLFGAPVESGIVERYGNVGPSEHATLVDPLPSDPDHALVAIWANIADPRTRVARMDVHTGRMATVAQAPVRRARFMVDAGGQVRFARGADASNASKLYYREHDRAEWVLVNDEAGTARVAVPLGMAADGTTAYMRVEQATGPDAVEAWNMATGERTQLQRDEVVDPYLVVHAADMRTPVGIQYMRDGMRLRLFDDADPMAALYRGLERAFAGSGFQVTSFTGDGKTALVRTWSDRVAGDYYLYDVESRHARGIYAQMDWLPAEQMAPMRAISLQARDGQSLHGYLAVPPGSSGPLPLVVLPHGGPYGIHEEWGFDAETQILASAGYAVLRLDFRGSGNYGRAFQLLGARQWGGTMQDDLTDATHWAVAEGIADPSRICIYGASYGGYAALMAVAKEPDLYRCAVGYVGVYDLVARHEDLSRYSAWTRNWVNDWLGERSMLKGSSPTELASRIRAPVFLAAGGADYIAPISHSRKMERALKRAGVPVETLFIDSEGHGFTTDANRRRFYVQLLDFLSRHLDGATARQGDA